MRRGHLQNADLPARKTDGIFASHQSRAWPEVSALGSTA
jgi:hypothetical protein